MSQKPAMTIPVVVIFYTVLALIAIVWDALRAGPSLLLPARDAAGLGESAALALAFSALLVVVSRGLERRFRWARRVTVELARIIGPLDRKHVAVYACASAIAEEMFFRGAMQPTLGIWVTSLIFGATHGYFDRRFLPWMVMAAVAGVGLGGLYEYTGGLLAPVLAHFTINYFEFHALDRVARGERFG